MPMSDNVSETTPDILDALIIGAGFSGIAAAIELDRAGFDNFIIAEKTGGISGTWYDNHYPGAACDIPSHLYSYSFAPNPDWSRRFSPSGEIMAYVENVTDKYNLRGKIRNNTEITSAGFDKEKSIWLAKTKNGETIKAKFLIISVAILGTPKLPDIKGIDEFAGQAFHSAKWDNSVDIKNKTIAVIGSAASAVQIVPQIAKTAKQVYVLQRTPNWIIPRRDRAYRNFEKTMFRYVPASMKLLRFALYTYLDRFFYRVFKSNGLVNKMFENTARKHLQKQIKDKSLIEKLTPDYPIGCKRVLLSDDYYPALQRNNVELVTDAIEQITKPGIKLQQNRKIKTDIIVYATGFAATEFLPNIELTGTNGAKLSNWRKNPQAYKGLIIPDMPNAFFMLGPNTGLGHASMILMIEAQTPYIAGLMAKTPKKGYFNIKHSANENYNKKIQQVLAKRIWATSCQSWYKTKNGDIPTLWPYTCAAYKKTMQKYDWDNYNFIKGADYE